MSGTYQNFKIERPIHVATPATRFLGRNISSVITSEMKPESSQEERKYNDLRIADTFKLEDGSSIVRRRWFPKPDDAAPANTDVTVTSQDGKVTQFSASIKGEIFTETDVQKDGFKNYKRNENGGIDCWEHGTAVEDPCGFQGMKFLIHTQSGFNGEYENDNQLNSGKMERFLTDVDGDGFYDKEVYNFAAERY